MKKIFTIIGTVLLLATLKINAQTVSFSELKNSATKSSSGTFAELLTSKGFTFIKRETDEYGSFYSNFATDYNSNEDSWSSLITIQSYNMVEFTFSDLKKTNFNNLLNQIKTNCKKECFKYTDHLNGYFTSYIASDSIKILVYTKKGENGYSDTYHIMVVKLFSDTEKMNFGIADRYNNAAWFFMCTDPSAK